MALSFEEFQRQWQDSSEDQSERVLKTAWQRYQQIQSGDSVAELEEDPTLEEMKAVFEPHLQSAVLVTKHEFITLPASNIPWMATGFYVHEDQPVSVFVTGKTWRSKLLNLYLLPKFNLWYRIGVNGSIFNSTHNTKTFMCMDGQDGEELFIANQFPGSFSDKEGGRVGGNLSAYDNAEGEFHLLIVEWKPGMSIHHDIRQAFQNLINPEDETKQRFDPFGLMTTAMDRLSSDYIIHEFPRGWTLLWFLGQSQIFYQEQEAITPQDREASHQLEVLPEAEQLGSEVFEIDSATLAPVIRCLPSDNVGILQKDLSPPVPLIPQLTASWLWNVIDLPSRLPEDTSFSHDYLSVAFEFENGRDITYMWSWELPVGYGYWCPLAAWCDREYHVVVKSGPEHLGRWFNESRNIYEDYVEYINEGNASKAVPTQIVKVWLIAGNRWQRHRGEMLVKKITLFDAQSDSEAIVVL